MKKETNFKIKNEIKNPSKGIFNENQKGYISDPRPIKEADFIKEAKSKLNKFIESTDCPITFDLMKFTKWTPSDIKTFFEHCIKIFCSNFRLLDSAMATEDRILNFFSVMQYKSSLTKTHITSPTILSSMPYVIAAFDYLRRASLTHINTHPAMLYPPLPIIDISSEHLIDAYAMLRKRTNKNVIDQNAILEFKNAISVKVIADEKRELETLSKIVTDVENLLICIETIDNQINATEIKDSQLISSIQSIDQKNNEIQKLNDKLLMKIDDIKVELNDLLHIKQNLDFKRNLFEDKGFVDLRRQVQCDRECLEKIVSRNRILQNEVDSLKQDIRLIYSEVEDLKQDIRSEFSRVSANFPYLLNEELQLMTNDFTVDHLLKYGYNLRPEISTLIIEIEKDIKIKRDIIENKKKNSEEMRAKTDILIKDVELLKLEEHQLFKSVHNNEIIINEMIEESSERNKLFLEIKNQLDMDSLENLQLQEEKVNLSNHLSYLQTFIDEGNHYYNVDIEYQKEIAELQLQSFQDSWDLQQNLFMEIENTLELKKEQAVQRELETLDFYEAELIKFDQEMEMDIDLE